MAMASIKGELESRAGQIVFCCGENLLQLFETHAPTFIVAKSGLLAAYSGNLRRQFDEDRAFANIAFKHGVLPNAKRALSQAYVKPDLAIPRYRYSITATIPGPARFEQQVWWEGARDAKRDYNAISALLRLANGYELIEPKVANVDQCCQRLIRLGDSVPEAWKRAYSSYRTAQARNGVTVTQNKVQLEIKEPEILKEIRDVAEIAGVLLKELGDRFSRQNALTKNAQADPLKVLLNRDSRLITAIHDLARRLPKAANSERLGTLSMDSETLGKIDGALLITGGAGFGKTTFCRWHAITDGERFVRRKTETLPVYVPLHQLAQGPLGTFQDTFLPDPELSGVFGGNSVGEARLRLYLDGLDEIPDQTRQEEILKLVRRELETNRQLDVVITAREHVGGRWLSWMPRVELGELTPAQVRELVAQLLANDSTKIDGFFHQLSLLPALQSLTGVPLLTMLIVAAYQHMGSLPENRVELYRIFVDLMCGGWDMAKGVRRDGEYGSGLKTAILMRLAMTLHFNRSREATAQQFKLVVGDFAPGLAEKWELVLSEILQDGLLVQNGAAFIFRHLSFQEYLCAVDLADPTNARKDQTLGWYLGGDDWWREVLTFYIGISKKPAELLQWLDLGASKSEAKGTQGVKERSALLRNVLAEVFPAFGSALPDKVELGTL
jgi:hypothetical protein